MTYKTKATVETLNSKMENMFQNMEDINSTVQSAKVKKEKVENSLAVCDKKVENTISEIDAVNIESKALTSFSDNIKTSTVDLLETIESNVGVLTEIQSSLNKYGESVINLRNKLTELASTSEKLKNIIV